MPAPMKASTEDIVAAYQATGSVWKAGKRLGLAGQTVHERLQLLGYPLLSRNWTPEETDELRALLTEAVTLSQIANRLGRPYAGVACKASELGIRSNQRRAPKLPRGAGWDKATTTSHMKALGKYGGPVTRYARANGLSIEMLVQAFQKHCPTQWQVYLEEHSDIPRKACTYCHHTFIPANTKQQYCSRACGSTARADRDYFGGNRRATVGLAERTCQLCERKDVKGLSSHHVYGKDNDPDNGALIALCQGCHKCVTLLATRLFVDSESGWEALISLAWLRRHGAEVAAGELADIDILHVTVDIDTYAEET